MFISLKGLVLLLCVVAVELQLLYKFSCYPVLLLNR